MTIEVYDGATVTVDGKTLDGRRTSRTWRASRRIHTALPAIAQVGLLAFVTV